MRPGPPTPFTAQDTSLEATGSPTDWPSLTQSSAALPISSAVPGQVPGVHKVPCGTQVTARE